MVQFHSSNMVPVRLPYQFLLNAYLSIDRHSLLDAHPSIDMHPLLNAHLSIDRHSLLDVLWFLVAHLFPDRHCRHPHLSLCTRPFMVLIVPLLWLTHFIQATLAWAVSLHESKLLWLTHFFQSRSCLLLHPSIPDIPSLL